MEDSSQEEVTHQVSSVVTAQFRQTGVIPENREMLSLLPLDTLAKQATSHLREEEVVMAL